MPTMNDIGVKALSYAMTMDVSGNSTEHDDARTMVRDAWINIYNDAKEYRISKLLDQINEVKGKFVTEAYPVNEAEKAEKKLDRSIGRSIRIGVIDDYLLLLYEVWNDCFYDIDFAVKEEQRKAEEKARGPRRALDLG